MTTLRLSIHSRLSPALVGGFVFLVAMLAVANLAAAHVVQVTTAIDIADVKSPHEFERALQAKVEEAANEAIAFEPAVVALTGMRIVGDQVLVGVLFADEAGKAMLESLSQGMDRDEDGIDDSGVRPTKIEI
jgi:hypothetical protein